MKIFFLKMSTRYVLQLYAIENINDVIKYNAVHWLSCVPNTNMKKVKDIKSIKAPGWYEAFNL